MPASDDTNANRRRSDQRLPAAEEGLQADPALTPYHRRPVVRVIALVAIAIVIVTLIVLTSQQHPAVQDAQKPPTPAAKTP
ncbi:MAG TPA: hypothetical protein VHA77_07915 [Xanthobacteraceae bacterium]|jgi:hypothetical protein|nr:hypothetical protein [Xanthobacteraceae bacterium]